MQPVLLHNCSGLFRCGVPDMHLGKQKPWQAGLSSTWSGIPTGMLLRSMLVLVLGVLEEFSPIMGRGCSCLSGVL